MVHVHLVTFKESFFQTIVGLPLSSHKLAESRIHCQAYLHKPYSHCRKTLGLEPFLNLAHASFICCQQFLLLYKWAVIPHLPCPCSGLVLQTLIVGCLLFRLRNPRLFFFLKFLKYIPPCSLNTEAIPPHLWSPLFFLRRRKFWELCVCSEKKRRRRKRDPKESFCIQSELEVAREKRIMEWHK